MKTIQNLKFKYALHKMSENQYEDALEILESLNPHRDPINPRILSYYGLCLAKAYAQLFEGLTTCRNSLIMDHHDPDIYHNLAQLYLLNGKHKSAINILYRGLCYEQKNGDSTKIRDLVEELVRRRPPFFKSLPRSHPFNKYIGKLTWARLQWIQQAELKREENRASFTNYLFLPVLGAKTKKVAKDPENKPVF